MKTLEWAESRGDIYPESLLASTVHQQRLHEHAVSSSDSQQPMPWARNAVRVVHLKITT